jgi:glucosamine-6-phosphate deaminase
LSSRTRIKTLTQQTIADVSRLFKPDEKQPTMAMTMGITTIMGARYVLLMATGANKASAVKDMITGGVSVVCPAFTLQMHENAIVLLDKAATSELNDQGYYQWADNENSKLIEDYGYFHNY